ncbi:hypothetical protein ACFPER_09040 [Agromyces aurantiacus]|uniref:DUF7882 domain-containing protein n=1 Tax=Agromyces aurantiacus TaxID=165814 RepID=A0ABV9R492_9MICO|nr:hypothetical protein [Agromyces aurantiacus]MBM7503616.1 hypothetical protein [Agromyces aurantiacus]
MPETAHPALEIDGWMRIELDDDVLAHVALVVFSKLRRNEPLLVSWTDPEGSAMQAWVHPNSTIVARHTPGVESSIDRVRAERMMVAANSTPGLRLARFAPDDRAGAIPAAQPMAPAA